MVPSSFQFLPRLARVSVAAALAFGCLGANAAAKYIVKVSHAVTVQHPGHKAMELFKKDVESQSGGQLEVRIFHSSQLAGQREGVEGLQSGSVEITLTPNGIGAAFDPTFAMLDIPFQFSDAAHARRFLDQGGEKMLFANLSKVGLVGLAVWEQGFRNLGTAKSPAVNQADLKGMKLRTMEAPLHILAWRSLGANPTPIGWSQVYTSLQQGVIDAVENPSYIFSQTPVHEQIKYLSLTKHIYDPLLVLGSKAFFDKLPADLRNVVVGSLQKITVQQRTFVDQDVEKAEKVDLPAKGVKIIAVSAEEQAKMAQGSQPAVMKEVESKVGADALGRWKAGVDARRVR